MADPSKAAQDAYIALYRGDTTLRGLMTGASSPDWNIFDQGGSGLMPVVFPAVFVHPAQSQIGAALSFGTDARDLSMFVEVYTEQEGFDQARQIAARIYRLTHGPAAGQPFPISGFTHIMTMCVQEQEAEQVGD